MPFSHEEIREAIREWNEGLIDCPEVIGGVKAIADVCLQALPQCRKEILGRLGVGLSNVSRSERGIRDWSLREGLTAALRALPLGQALLAQIKQVPLPTNMSTQPATQPALQPSQ